MKQLTAQSGPKMVLDVSDAEKAAAKEIKEDFGKLLKKLDNSVKVIMDLRDAIVEQRPSQEDLKNKYRGRLLRYKRKIQTSFNEFLSGVQASLEKLSKVLDPETMKLREIIIAELDELSDGAEAIMDNLSEVDREGFTKTIEQIASQMEKRQKSIVDVIENQLYNHIEQDILGRMKISTIQTRIRRRKRLIKQMVRNGNI